MVKYRQNYISVLVFLCFITTIIVTTLSLSRYKTTITTSSDAKVAKLEITAKGNLNTNLQLDYSNSAMQSTNYAFTISSKSEVGMTYNVAVVVPESWPNTVSLQLFQNIENTEKEMTLITKENNKYIWKNNFEICENEETIEHEYILKFSFNSQVDNDTSINGIKISVDAEQIN